MLCAIPALLQLLDIAQYIITIDAMGTEMEITDRIQEGANYVLALKANYLTLYREVEQWFSKAQSSNFQGIEYSYDFGLGLNQDIVAVKNDKLQRLL